MTSFMSTINLLEYDLVAQHDKVIYHTHPLTSGSCFYIEVNDRLDYIWSILQAEAHLAKLKQEVFYIVQE